MRLLVAALVIGFSLGLAGCSGSGDDADAATPAPTPQQSDEGGAAVPGDGSESK